MADYFRSLSNVGHDFNGSDDSFMSRRQRLDNIHRGTQAEGSRESNKCSTTVSRTMKIHVFGSKLLNSGRLTQFVYSFILFSQLLASSYGQRQPPCACSPRAILFTVDFSGICPPEQIQTGAGSGITTAFCSITEDPIPGLPPSNDLVPVQITNVNIFELSMDMTVMRQTFSTVALSNGDSFPYLSFNSSDPSYDPIADLPGGLQVDVKGRNQLGRGLTNGFILKYSNLCDVVPFNPGDSIGWLNFTEITPPTGDTCSLFTDPPTKSPIPSALPSSTLSSSPSKNPSSVPSTSPSDAPSVKSSDSPSGNPSGTPSSSPSGNPTSSLSTSPSDSPTDNLSSNPTAVLTSNNPSSSPSNIPSSMPSNKSSSTPSSIRSSLPSNSPSTTLSSSPSRNPTKLPTKDLVTESPTTKPSIAKSETPSGTPSDSPTSQQTLEPSEEPSLSFSMSYSYRLAASEFLSDLFNTKEDLKPLRVQHTAGVSRSSFLSEIYSASESPEIGSKHTDEYAEMHKVKRKKGRRR